MGREKVKEKNSPVAEYLCWLIYPSVREYFFKLRATTPERLLKMLNMGTNKLEEFTQEAFDNVSRSRSRLSCSWLLEQKTGRSMDKSVLGRICAKFCYTCSNCKASQAHRTVNFGLKNHCPQVEAVKRNHLSPNLRNFITYSFSRDSLSNRS